VGFRRLICQLYRCCFAGDVYFWLELPMRHLEPSEAGGMRDDDGVKTVRHKTPNFPRAIIL
jgi:hypothetical protein